MADYVRLIKYRLSLSSPTRDSNGLGQSSFIAVLRCCILVSRWSRRVVSGCVKVTCSRRRAHFRGALHPFQVPFSIVTSTNQDRQDVEVLMFVE